MQKVQNAAAGFVLKRHADIKDVIDLKWLPVIETMPYTILIGQLTLTFREYK